MLFPIIVIPDTFNVILLFNVVKPDIFNDDIIVTILYNIVNPLTMMM